MSRRIAAFIVIGITCGIGSAYAQESGTHGGGLVEVTYMPAGAGFVMSKGDSPSFGNYGFGTAAAFNVNRLIGIEGELVAMIATSSDLQFGDLPHDIKAPNALGYNADVIVSPWGGRALSPYAAGGVGGLTMFARPALTLTDDETFLTGNVGGGVKWYAPNNRWGLRGDYRFVATKSKDDAPEFFGRETRYIHRAYAGVIINTKP